ncbi:hypothetical protein ABBQ38_004330 [Trebouxia sp. C0009 RCD-2024]
MVGAAQSTTGSLQRSRQVLVEQIDSTQTILAAMDASHEQLQKKRSLYFVPTFVKTGLGKLVPTWSRSSAQEADQLVRPSRAIGDDPGIDGFRQKPSPETLRNANQTDALLKQHTRESQAASEPLGAKQEHATLPPEKDRQPATVTVASPSQAEQHKPSDSHEQVNQPKSSADDLGQAADRQVPPTGKVTHQQMQDSGYADAFAQIMEAIPDHVKQHASTQPADPKSVPQSDSAPSQPASVLAEGAYSSEVGAAVAAAMDQLAKQQEQQQQAVSLDVGAAYPEHAAQVLGGEDALTHHSAMLNNDSILLHHNASDNSQHVSDQHLQGAMPNSTSDAMPDSLNGARSDSTSDAMPSSTSDTGDSVGFRDNVSSAGQHLLNGTQDSAVEEPQLDVERPREKSESVDHDLREEAAKSTDQESFQSEAGDLASVSQLEPRLSVPQEVHASSAGDVMVNQNADKRFVTQQQMDESGHADAFAEIMKNIPDHIRDVKNLPDMAANSEPDTPASQQPSLHRADSDSAGSSHSSDTQHHQHGL